MMLLLLVVGAIKAQSVSPWVISSSGGYFQNANFSVSSTFAEMTLVETFGNANNFLTQGFQQPFALSTDVPAIPTPEVNKFKVYPNPNNGLFAVNYQLNETGQLGFKVYDLLGQQVYSRSISQSMGIHETSFSLSNLNSGIYFLETTFVPVSGKQIVTNQKINILR